MQLSILLFLVGVSLASAAKILLLPSDHKGHVNFFKVASQELQRRGHEPVILVQQRNKNLIENAGIKSIVNYGKTESPLDDSKRISSGLFSSGLSQFFSVLSMSSDMTKNIVAQCYEVMTSESMMDAIKKENFDILLMDGVDIGRCFYILPYKLDLPYITLTARHDPWSAALYPMASVEGYYGLTIMKPDSSYLDIIKNFAIHAGIWLMFPPTGISDSQIKDLAPEKPETTYTKLYQGSAVFLINADNTCMDYPRIEAPHYHFIGGVAASPAKPVAKEFEDFISKASEGLIIVSFGSIFKQTPAEMMGKMLESFRKIPQYVIMRYDGEFENVPPNVMLSKWLPQNDLLGHSKTQLFIAHGGANGQMEALYHGIPMVVMPIFGDQIYGAARAVGKRFGLSINPLDFTSDELNDAISEVLTNPIYTENMKKCAGVSKDFPGAHDNIDFWVKHVMKFGGDHLRPISLDMPLYRGMMLDVILIVVIFDIVMCYVMFRCCRFIVRRCRSRKGDSKKEKVN